MNKQTNKLKIQADKRYFEALITNLQHLHKFEQRWMALNDCH